MKPNILNPKFKYVPSYLNDTRKTIAKARKELRESDAKRAPVVGTIEPKKKAGA